MVIWSWRILAVLHRDIAARKPGELNPTAATSL